MIDFKEVTLDLKPMVDSYFRNSGNFGSEYTFSNTFIWRKKNRTRIAEHNGFLFVKYIIKGQCYFLLPIAKSPGDDIGWAINELIGHTSDCDCNLAITGISSEKKGVIQNLMPGVFEYKQRPDWYDYIYSTEDLINLRGSNYQPKRNHINKFELLNGNETFETMGKNNVEECLDTYSRWAEVRAFDDIEDEKFAVTEALHNFEALGLKGGISRVNGKVCAFTLGSELNDEVFVTHIEKGLSDCPGVYAAINRDFAKSCLSSYRYINREEDLGVEGLRKAKRSYYPIIHLEKCLAIYKEPAL
jgi:uncharacterized protein